MCGDPGCQGLRECSHRQRRRTLHQGLGRVWAFPKVRGCSCTNILPFGNGNHSTDANRERKKYADAQKIYLRALEVLPACEVGPTVSSPRYVPSYDQDSSAFVTNHWDTSMPPSGPNSLRAYRRKASPTSKPWRISNPPCLKPTSRTHRLAWKLRKAQRSKRQRWAMRM